MEFFICIKNKIIENYFLVILFLITIILNDIILVNTFKSKNVKNEPITNERINVNSQEEKEEEKKIKVDIKGYVKKPNVYEIADGSNVLDLINLAGGLKKGATTENINLSKKLKDEMVIIISKKSEYKKILENSNSNIAKENNDAAISPNEVVGINEEIVYNNLQNTNSTLVNINYASLEDLLQLPGIGESKAKSIIDYREKTPFNSIEDIKNISGIGDSIFEKIKDKIIV